MRDEHLAFGRRKGADGAHDRIDRAVRQIDEIVALPIVARAGVSYARNWVTE
jgi:hypothetical protein